MITISAFQESGFVIVLDDGMPLLIQRSLDRESYIPSLFEAAGAPALLTG